MTGYTKQQLKEALTKVTCLGEDSGLDPNVLLHQLLDALKRLENVQHYASLTDYQA